MKRTAWAALGAVMVCAVLAGCAGGPPRGEPRDDMFGEMPRPVTPFEAERRYRDNTAPSIGLALSGGGTKAAVFAHGVLHGLQERGVLQKVDVISSTSGGGYAAYWLMSKRVEAALQAPPVPSLDEIFKDCFPAWLVSDSDPPEYRAFWAHAEQRARAAKTERCADTRHFAPGDPYRWQAHLMRWPDVFKPTLTELQAGPELAPLFNDTVDVLATLLQAPFLPFTADRDSYLAESYQYGIERAWGLQPKVRAPATGPETDKEWQYHNLGTTDRWTRELWRVDPRSLTWDKLRAAYAADPTMPLWVLNTTQGQKEARKPNPLNLFELTPFSYGSAQWGYVPEGPSAKTQLDSVARGVRASAAFADAQGLGQQDQIRLLHAFSRVFPGASWGVPFRHRYVGEPLHLSDGGGADDLALVSLVRRGLKDIIIVDTAADSGGIMDDLCWSRALLAQANYTMDFPALGNLEPVCGWQFQENPPDADKHAYNVSAWMNPVVHGTLKARDGTVTDLWLIKAAWDEQRVRRAFNEGRCGYGQGKDGVRTEDEEINCMLPLFWANQGQEEGRFISFPQHGTAKLTLNSSSKVNLAYRELGRSVARHLVVENGRVRMTNNQCVQPVLKWVKHGRPEARGGKDALPECVDRN